ncbi:MAG: hypothetical protein SH821_02165 [Phototrophicales bacterium]|nr:hypothetical protein [Phototrophicales bacterium]
MTVNDDTKPRKIVSNYYGTVLPPPDDDEFVDPPPTADIHGPGCLVWGIMGVFIVILSVVFVVLAGAAGWTEGQRLANGDATATQAEFINESLRRIPTDVAMMNDYNFQLRLNALAQMTPGVPQVPELQITATAMAGQQIVNLQLTQLPQDFINNDRARIEQRLAYLLQHMPNLAELPAYQATATAYINLFTPTATLEVVQAVATAPSQVAPTLNATGQFDLPALFATARQQVDFGQLAEAYNTLDIIIRVDETYERNSVRGLMNLVLTRQAQPLYASLETLAEAIRLTDLAEEYGDIGELNYERLIAALYLNVVSASGSGNHAIAIRRLGDILQYQSTYKGINLNQVLYDEYVAYGDALVTGAQACQAVPQYRAALNLFSSGPAAGKRDVAQAQCNASNVPATSSAPVGEIPTYEPIAP